MRTLFLFVSFLLVLFQGNSQTAPKKRFQRKMEGEWIAQDGFGLSFLGNHANYQTRYSYQPYFISKDTLILKANPKDLPSWKGDIKFRVLERWGSDSLKIQVLQHPYEAVNSVKILQHTTLFWKSIGRWDSVIYTSHPCFGNCENFRLKITPDGVVEYRGIYRTDPLGTYSFIMNWPELNKLEQLLYCSNFEKQPAIWDLPQDLYAQTVEFFGRSGKVIRVHADNFSPEFNWLCYFFQQLKLERSPFFIKDETNH
jgi:hypothetical protein